jgi:hypothetical protein
MLVHVEPSRALGVAALPLRSSDTLPLGVIGSSAFRTVDRVTHNANNVMPAPIQ